MSDLAFIAGKTMRVRLRLLGKNEAGEWVPYPRLAEATAVRLQVGARAGGTALFTLVCTVIDAVNGIVEALFLPSHTATLAGLFSIEAEVEFSPTEIYGASFGSGGAEPRLGTLKLIAGIGA